MFTMSRQFLVRILLTTAILFLAFGLMLPTHSAQAASLCTVLDVTGPTRYTATIFPGHSYTVWLYVNGLLAQDFPQTLTPTSIQTETGYAPVGYHIVITLNNCASPTLP